MESSEQFTKYPADITPQYLRERAIGHRRDAEGYAKLREQQANCRAQSQRLGLDGQAEQELLLWQAFDVGAKSCIDKATDCEARADALELEQSLRAKQASARSASDEANYLRACASRARAQGYQSQAEAYEARAIHCEAKASEAKAQAEELIGTVRALFTTEQAVRESQAVREYEARAQALARANEADSEAREAVRKLRATALDLRKLATYQSAQDVAHDLESQADYLERTLVLRAQNRWLC